MNFLKWTGTVTGIVGATVIALNLPLSGWGFVLFLISSVSWTVAGLRMRENSLVVLQAAFTAINLLGIYPRHSFRGENCESRRVYRSSWRDGRRRDMAAGPGSGEGTGADGTRRDGPLGRHFVPMTAPCPKIHDTAMLSAPPVRVRGQPPRNGVAVRCSRRDAAIQRHPPICKKRRFASIGFSLLNPANKIEESAISTNWLS